MKLTAVFAALVAVVVSACAAPPPPPAPTGHEVRYITRDGADGYTFAATGDTVTVTAANTNRGTNSRTVLWSTETPATVDQQVCATFESGIWPTQEGVALRAAAGDHPGRAITVMKNVWAFATQYFNVQLVDLSKPEGRGLMQAPYPSANFGTVLGAGPGPWRLCARTVGNQLSFKVWRTADIEPSWDDPLGTRTVTLTDEWVYPGNTGIYAGHLPAGGAAVFTEVTAEYF